MATDPQEIDWPALAWELTEAAKAFEIAKREVADATNRFAAARHRLDLARNAQELALEKIGAMLNAPQMYADFISK